MKTSPTKPPEGLAPTNGSRLSPTPETNAVAFDLDWMPDESKRVVQSHGIFCEAKHARKLERDRDAERELADNLAGAVINLRQRLKAHGLGDNEGVPEITRWADARTMGHPENVSEHTTPRKNTNDED